MSGLWYLAGASALGAAHQRRGTPNQDALQYAPHAGPAAHFAAAVADGHGAALHHRSDVGARHAVAAALAVLEWFQDGETEPAQLVPQIVQTWRQSVLAHAADHPLDQDWVEDEADRLLPYGATLIAVAATAEALVALQVGDGDLLLGFPDGRLARPLPDDADTVGEQTYSICAPDAERYFRLHLLRRAGARDWPDFVMLSTDGVAKSFADERAFLGVAQHYRKLMQAGGAAAVQPALADWLADVSRRGSGDDTTLFLAARHPG